MRRGALLCGLAFAALGASTARAAIQLDGDRYEGAFDATHFGFDFVVGAGSDRYMVVAVTTALPAAALSVTFAGAPFGFLGRVASPSAGCQVEWWGLLAPAEGAHALAVELAAPAHRSSASIVSYRGVDPVQPIGRFVSATGPAAPSALTIPSALDDVVLDAICGWSPDSILYMAGDGQTAYWHWSIEWLSAAGGQAAGGPSVTMTWTSGPAEGHVPGDMEWAAAGISVQPARPAMAAPPLPPPMGPVTHDVKLSVGTASCAVAGERATGATPLALLILLGFWTVRRQGRGAPEDVAVGTSGAPSRATPRSMSPPASARATHDEADPDLDEVTLARAKAGDASAQTALVQRYKRPVFSLLWRMVGPDRAIVEDLTQETFLRVFRALRNFEYDGRARLITWILTIATRLALGHLRASKPHRDTAIAPGSVPVALPRPDQDADRRALAVALVQAVEGLGDPFRAAFLLREVHGLSYDEIAVALSIDIGTVKSRLARARGILQAALAEMHDE